MTGHRHDWRFAQDSAYPSCDCGATMVDGVVQVPGAPEPLELAVDRDVAQAFGTVGEQPGEADPSGAALPAPASPGDQPAQGTRVRLTIIDEVANLSDEDWQRVLALRGADQLPPDPVGWEQLENALRVLAMAEHELGYDRVWLLTLPGERLYVTPYRPPTPPPADRPELPPYPAGVDQGRLAELESAYRELSELVAQGDGDLRRHWRVAIDMWKFWKAAYQADVGEPDAELQWVAWRGRAQAAEAELKRG